MRHPCRLIETRARRSRARQRRARLALATCLLSIVLAIWSVPALALSQRGHVFAQAFGEPGSAAGQLSEPAGVAVAEASGDVYVVDRGNNRIERFGPDGQFISAWGWGVKDGAKEFEICESSCQPGIPGSGKGQLDSPEAVAVDNSTNTSDPSRGDVYVITDARSERSHLTKFTATGEPIGSLKQEGSEAKWEGALDGVSVDGSGRLWVYRGAEATGEVERFGDEVKNLFEEPVLESPVTCPKPGFAVDATGERLYVDHELESHDACPQEEGQPSRSVLTSQLSLAGETLETGLNAMDQLPSSAVASEAASGDVYVSNLGTVGAFDDEGALIQRLSLPGATPAARGVAADSATGEVYVADAAAGKIDVFEPEPAGKPVVSHLAAEDLTSSSTELSAQVDPTGSDTRYYFQYGTADCESSPGSCTDVPAPPGTDIGSGFADRAASVELEDLAPSTTYFYRILASNGHGEAGGAETFASMTTLPSAEGLLPDGRAWEMVSPAEKDGSGIEPLRKEGGLIQASEDGDAITYVANGPIVPEPEGNRAPYPTQALAQRGASGWSSQQITTPRTKGEGFIPGEAPEYRFFSSDLSQALVQPDNHSPNEPLEQPPLSPEATEKTMYLRDSATGEYAPVVTADDDTAGTHFGQELEFVDATPDLSHVVLSSAVPLTAGGAAGLYEWRSGAPLLPISLLPDGSPALEPEVGDENHNVRGAVSSDGTRVVWTGESEVQVGEESEVVRHLYMRDTATGQTLQLDAAAPGVQEPGEEESEVGFQGANAEGTRVFFTDTARLTEDSDLAPVNTGVEPNPPDLYECRVVEEHERLACVLSDLTVDQNIHESADVLNVAPGLSEDGAYVYFVANGVLAPGAKPGDCVQEDQEVASAGATCSLYLSHEGATTFIATLSNEDSGDWGSTQGAGARGELIEPRPDLASVTSGTSPSGQYLAFMSDRELTGYDNRDANPAANGARDEEVYLYDAHTKLLVCASCNPSGARPHGVFDTENAGEGLGLLVDRAQNWADEPEAKAPTAHWLAGSLPGWSPLGNESDAQALRQPRYISDSGRLFFDSADPLVAVEHAHTRQEIIDGEAVQVGVESVYEYNPDGLSSCVQLDGCVGLISTGTAEQESALVDASADGSDAFFVTAQQLVAQDKDSSFDLYDARVCTAQSPCVTSEGASATPCESSDTCRLTPASPPAAQDPSGTAVFSGPGDSPSHEVLGDKAASQPKPATRKQRLEKALKACRTHWKHARRRRLTCEAHARKAYSAKRAAGHHGSPRK